MGYLSLVIMELNIMNLHRRNMLFCSEWYGLISPYSPFLHSHLPYNPILFPVVACPSSQTLPWRNVNNAALQPPYP